MNRYKYTLIITAFVIYLFLLNDNTFANDDYPLPVMAPDGTIYIGAGASQGFWDSGSVPPEGGEICGWGFYADEWGYYCPWDYPYMSFNWNDPGTYEVRMVVMDDEENWSFDNPDGDEEENSYLWYDSCQVLVFKSTMWNVSTPITYGTGTTFTYNILPSTGWSPDSNSIRLEISSDNSPSYVRAVDLTSYGIGTGKTYHWDGKTPANAVQFGTRYDGTENLGAQSYNNDTVAVGKVVPIGTISPSGVKNIVSSGFTFERQRMSHDFDDGVKSTTYWDTTWQPDTSYSQYQNLTPDVNDQIFDRDAPNIAQFGNTDSSETYNNFRQWITWNSQVASDQYTEWYWQGRWKNGENPEITLKDVGTGTISLPDANDAFYDPPH